jgi:hypothetical protein
MLTLLPLSQTSACDVLTGKGDIPVELPVRTTANNPLEEDDVCAGSLGISIPSATRWSRSFICLGWNEKLPEAGERRRLGVLAMMGL